ncbi:hypothetical protein QE152_g7803 [Popillia japonica]|uniref:Uncharacterized protein n=1 Tax=Popillia japonica TaxID=7064 RepID=A0AAW1ME09_POPJA
MTTTREPITWKVELLEISMVERLQKVHKSCHREKKFCAEISTQTGIYELLSGCSNISKVATGKKSSVLKSLPKQASMNFYLDAVTSSQSKTLKMLVLRAFWTNRLPLNSIEESNFVEMVKGLCRGYILPNRRKLSGEFHNMEHDRVIDVYKSQIAKSLVVTLEFHNMEHDRVIDVYKSQIAKSLVVTLVNDGWSNIRHDSYVIVYPSPGF